MKLRRVGCSTVSCKDRTGLDESGLNHGWADFSGLEGDADVWNFVMDKTNDYLSTTMCGSVQIR